MIIKNGILAPVQFFRGQKTIGGIKYVAPPEPFYVQNITNSNETLSIGKYHYGGGDPDDAPTLAIEYSTDKTNWSSLGNTSSTPLTLTVEPDQKVYLRCATTRWGYGHEQANNSIRGVSKVGGDILSLLYGDQFTGEETTLNGSGCELPYILGGNTNLLDASALSFPTPDISGHNDCYRYMFAGCSNLLHGPDFSQISVLSTHCFAMMFQDCSALLDIIAMPIATDVKRESYSHMFKNCSSMAVAPTFTVGTCDGGWECCSMFNGCSSLNNISGIHLNATSLNSYSYDGMFNGCSALTSVPSLPATSLGYGCYNGMFRDCSSLTSVPANLLPATTLTDGCYRYMFSVCTSLTNAPSLPATTVTQLCYAHMFENCSALTSVPSLPATTLAYECYAGMFYCCKSLTSIPTNLLPATTLAEGCYRDMFRDCDNITNGPDLPATTPANYCYRNMFTQGYRLSSLKCMLADFNATEPVDDWMYDVAASGTFTKNANNNSWPSGQSGIPSGWTVVDA